MTWMFCFLFSGTMDKVCAFCSRGEKSLLGQGELTRYEPTPGFNPFKKQLSRSKRTASDAEEGVGKRGSQHLTWRRSRGTTATTTKPLQRSVLCCVVVFCICMCESDLCCIDSSLLLLSESKFHKMLLQVCLWGCILEHILVSLFGKWCLETADSLKTSGKPHIYAAIVRRLCRNLV